MTTHNKRHILAVLLGLSCFMLWGQTTNSQPNYTLTANESGAVKKYLARDFVKLQTGFQFAATGSNTFNAKVDPCILYPPTPTIYVFSDGSSATTPTKVINGKTESGTQEVGTIPGQFAVSPTGAATYSMPIEVPAGINGMHPNLSIVYNSQGGNGILGLGTAISGLSAINRVPPSYYYDGNVAPVYSATQRSDKFMLDGMRLLPVTGSSNTYQTEINSYATITNEGTLNDPNQYFKVITKEGITMEYGATANARSVGANNVVMAWNISKMTDLNGNYLEYFYNIVDGVSLIDRIEYGKNTNTETNIRSVVIFRYKTRPDKSMSYQYGLKYTQSQCLDYIATIVNGTYIRKYSMNYEVDEMSHLKTITLSTGSGKSYRPTTFTWGAKVSTANIIASTSTAFSANQDMILYPGDFNGDGRTDFITVPRKASYTSADNWVLVLSQADGTFLNKQTGALSSTFEPANSRVVDINADGKDDLLLYSKDTQFNKYRYQQYMSYFADPTTPLELQTQDFSATSYATELQIGNFDGNGFPDCMVLRRTAVANQYTANIYSAYIKKLASGDEAVESLGTATANSLGGGLVNTTVIDKPRYLLDYDGDGRTDYMYLTDAGCEIYSGTTLIKIYSGIFPKKTDVENIKFGDFNGDGKTDILLKEKTELVIEYRDEVDIDGDIYQVPNLNKNTYVWTPYYSQGVNTGVGFLASTNVFTHVFDGVSHDYPERETIQIVDANGDGKSDILEYYSVFNISTGLYPETSVLKLSLSDGNGNFNSSGVMSIAHPRGETDFNFGDFNGDGKVDCLYRNNNTSAYQLITFFKNDKRNQLVAIVDGMGKRTDISYARLNEQPPVTGIEANKYYRPKISKIQQSSFMVVNAHWSDGLPTRKTTYQYIGGNVHREGRGFLGFDVVIISDLENKKMSRQYSTLNTDYYFLYPVKSEVFGNVSGTSATLVSETTSTYSAIPTLKVTLGYENQLRTLTQKDALTAITNSTTYYYTYGEVSDITEVKGNIKKTVSRSFVKLANGCVRKEQEYTTYQTMSGNTVIEESPNQDIVYGYSTTGNLTSSSQNISSNKDYIYNVYSEFDNFGHPTQTSSTINDPRNLTTQLTRTTLQTYTTSGRFIASKTDVFGQTTTYEWDEKQGVLLKEISRLGTTTYKYDDFGNCIMTITPNGIQTIKTVQWASGGPTDAWVCRHEESSGSAPVKTWIDKEGKILRKDTYGLDKASNADIMVSYEYNPNGTLHRVSDPYFATETKKWTTYAYDPYGRIESETKPTNAVSTIKFEKKITTKEAFGEKTITTLDDAGRVSTTEVNGKTVSFVYYPNGLLKSSTPQDGTAVSMIYDRQGNRIRLTDPNAGVTRAEYNAWGELLWERQRIHLTGDSITTNNYYDGATGQLTSIVRNGETTSYIYDPKHRISSIEITGKHKQSFEYDNWDRVISSTEQIGIKNFVTAKKYDSFGRVIKETYPSGYYVTNTYDKYSNLIEVTDQNNKQIQKLLLENAKGQVVELAKGNKTTVYEYNDLGLTTNIAVDGVIDLGYTYDSKFNLFERTEKRNGTLYQKEQMGYEPTTNRLQSWTATKGSTVKTYSIVYDDATGKQGNIQTKTDLGVYDFGYGEKNGKPHALTSIASVPANFPQPTTAYPTAALEVTYTDFKKINTLSEMGKTYVLTYGVDDQRRKSEYYATGGAQGTPTLTKYYVGSYEEEVDALGNIRKIHYLGSAIYIETLTPGGTSTNTLYYSYADFQGSLVALTDAEGKVLTETVNGVEKEIGRFAYDPWGARRNADNWTLAATTPSGGWGAITSRGYTGHEHLDAFGIINMNGRVYDPLTAQFFSPDPALEVSNWLNYNRYSYCNGNPFKYTDPSGNNPLLVAALIGGFINLISQGNQGKIHNFGQFIGAFAVGAAAGALGYGIGTGIQTAISGASFWAGFVGCSQEIAAITAGTSSFGTGLLAGLGGGFAGGFVGGFGNSLNNGDSFQTALSNGWDDARKGALIGGLAGGIAGGIDAVKNGRSFWDGAYELDYITQDPGVAWTDGQCVPFSNKASFGTENPDFSKYIKNDKITQIDESTFKTLKRLHSQGYNRAQINVDNYVNRNSGAIESHRMAIKQIRFKPDHKFFQIKVYDSGKITTTITKEIINGTTSISTSSTNEAVYNLLRSPGFDFKKLFLWAPR